MSARRLSVAPVAAVLVPLAVAVVAVLAAPAPAAAARLAGGAEQAAVRRAFEATKAHRTQLIASIRTSTVNPAWAVVRAALPQPAGRTGPHARAARLTSTYYERVGGRERPAAPPGGVRADLSRPFRVAVVFTGSGTESVAYDQAYRSDCAGAGGFSDQETVTVRPMSWTIRYIVNLDTLLAATRSPQGPALVPAVMFDARHSRLTAVERLTHTFQDLGCNRGPVTSTCTKTFHAGGSDPAGALTLPTGRGLEVGVPLRAAGTGACDPADYPLGPSLWESGAAGADARPLGLVGGRLPANPYAPVRVSWPGNSGAQSHPLAASPCQGDAAVCTDAFTWHGTVRLEPAG